MKLELRAQSAQELRVKPEVRAKPEIEWVRNPGKRLGECFMSILETLYPVLQYRYLATHSVIHIVSVAGTVIKHQLSCVI